MKRIDEIITEDIQSIGIAGHVNPDGDCVGSCTALLNYLKKVWPQIPTIDLYLEPPKPSLLFLKGAAEARNAAEGDISYDLFITCDVSEYNRIAVAQSVFDRAKKRVCIDHHVSNPGFADINHIVPDASSCAEVLCGLFDMEKVDAVIAESLYTGIIHDSGVFQYPNTSPDTMRIAARLMETGIDFNRIIDDSFNRRTYSQNRVLGHCLQKAEQTLGGKCITAWISQEEMRSLGVTKQDLDIVVPQMRLTEGAEAAAFAYEITPGTYKVSLRSNDYLDVSAIAQMFEGGGHFHAAGCTIPGTPDEVFGKLVAEIEKHI